MKHKDYYAILGAARNATHDQMKQAYRKVARRYHPDISKESNAESRFKDIGEAYEVLKDPEKRAAYDRFGAHWQQGLSGDPSSSRERDFEFSGYRESTDKASGHSDFFESFFRQGQANGQKNGQKNGRGSQTFRMKGEDQHAKIIIPLADAYHGTRQAITLSRSVLDSSGRLITSPHTLHVTIPKGIVEGQRIRLEGQGLPGYGDSPHGDLFVEIAFQAEGIFHAEKRDVHLTLPITPWEAALGATLTVPTLGGNVQLKIPPGSQGGKKLRLKGKGLCTKSHHGDQIVTLQVVIPEPQNEEQRSLYRTMAEKMPINPRAGLEN